MAVRFSDEQVTRATGARKSRAGARSSYEAVCTDTRTLSAGCLFVALVGERFDAHQFLPQAAAGGAAGAVVALGHPHPEGLPSGFGLFEVPDTLLALGALAGFHRSRFQVPVVAITGSNGKTTTKEMVASILSTRGEALKTEGNLNNEVGVPLTLFRLGPTHVAAVIEMGMNHAGEIARLAAIAQPDAGLITVVQPAHLHGLGSIEGVADAKGELFRGLRPGATAVVNADDPRILAQGKASGIKQLTFGAAAQAQVRLREVGVLGREGLLVQLEAQGEVHRVRLAFVGQHNALNACGAFALALAVGYSPRECVAGLEAARPYARRLNLVDAAGGVTVLDDCYNANPSSMEAALGTLGGLAAPGHAVAVLGDMLELGPDERVAHQALGAKAAQLARAVAFFGPRSVEGLKAASTLGARAAHFTEVEPLMKWLLPQLGRGDVVLVKGSRGMRLERVVEALSGTTGKAEH